MRSVVRLHLVVPMDHQLRSLRSLWLTILKEEITPKTKRLMNYVDQTHEKTFFLLEMIVAYIHTYLLLLTYVEFDENKTRTCS